MFKRITLAFGITALLSGCASSVFDLKSSEFGCSGMPQGVKCMSLKEVYSATDNSDFVNGEVAEEWRNKKNGNSKSNTTAANVTAASALVATPAADKPLPIRHPAKIMRVWINSFEDNDGDLYAGQYVFSEIEPRKWSIGAEKNTETGGTNPLLSGSRNTVRETESPLNAR